MPVTTVSNTTPTTIYTSEHATKEAPDQLVFRISKGVTGSVAVIDTDRGDTLFTQGFYLDSGETLGIALLAGQSVQLLALTAPVTVVWHVQEF